MLPAIMFVTLSFSVIQVLSSKIIALITQLELARQRRDELLEGVQEGVAVLDAQSRDIFYCNAALRDDDPDQKN